MDQKLLNSFGLILDFIGVVILLIYAKKTTGAITQADRDYVASPWWAYSGYFLLAFGFLFQILSNLL
jgi:hypothetical protein